MFHEDMLWFPGCPAWIHPRPDQQGHLQHPDRLQQPDPEVRGGGLGVVLERADGLPLVQWRGMESGILWAFIATFGSSETAPGVEILKESNKYLEVQV